MLEEFRYQSSSISRTSPHMSAHATFSETAHRLRDAGYIPIPMNGKKPALRKWQKITPPSDEFLDRLMGSFSSFNTGVLTGRLVAIDIDIDDASEAHEMSALAISILGMTNFFRIGRAPRRALIYRSETPRPKKTVGQVEVLGAGQFVTAFGMHPDTGQPYKWPLDSILDHAISELPVLSAQTIDKFIDAAAAQQQRPLPNTRDRNSQCPGRNNTLFRALKDIAATMSDTATLPDIAHELNLELKQPLPPAEVAHIVGSISRYKISGRLYVKGRQFIQIGIGTEKIQALARVPMAASLYLVLKSTRKDEPFTIPQAGTAKYLGVGKVRLRKAIRSLIQLGLITRAPRPAHATSHVASVYYRFSTAH